MHYRPVAAQEFTLWTHLDGMALAGACPAVQCHSEGDGICQFIERENSRVRADIQPQSLELSPVCAVHSISPTLRISPLGFRFIYST